MPNLKPRGPSANPPARLRALQGARIDDPNIRQAIEALQEWVEVRLGSRGDPYERAITQREYSKDALDLEQRLRAIETSLAQLVKDNTDNLAAGNVSALDIQNIQEALRALNFELGRNQNTPPGITASGTGYAKLQSGAISALSVADTRLELQGDGTVIEAVGYRGWPVSTKSANYTLVPSDNGKLFVHPAADTAGRVFTIGPGFSVGSKLAFANETATSLRLTSADSLVLIGGIGPSDIGVPQNGLALAWKITSTKWLVWGQGLASAGPGAATGLATVSGVGWSVEGDARRLNRLLILHGNGTHGSTTITDNSPVPITSMTAYNGASITTATKKFGSGSIALDGTDDFLSANSGVSSGAWTLQGSWELELQYRPNVTPTAGSGSTSIQMLYCRRLDDNTRTFLGYSYWTSASLQSTPGLWFRIDSGGSLLNFITDVTLSTSSFTHIRLSYDGTTYRMFINGALQNSTVSSLKHCDVSTITLEIGTGWSSSFWANGYIDEYILTAGDTVTTAAFTAPTTELLDYIKYGAAPTVAGTSTAAAAAAYSGQSRGLSQAGAYSSA